MNLPGPDAKDKMRYELPLLRNTTGQGEDRLKIELELKIGFTTHTILGADVKNLELCARTYGFVGRLDFFVHDDKASGGKQKDEVYSDFIKDDLIQVKLTVRAIYPDHTINDSADPLTVKGLVTDKALSSIPHRTAQGAALLVNRYTIRFVDPAQHLWQQHFPCTLYTKKTLKAVIDAQKSDKIAIDYKWAELTKQRPLIFLGHEPGSGQASFYDFIVWLVDSNGAALWYDYRSQKLVFDEELPTLPHSTDIYHEDLGDFQVVYPEVARHKVKVLNSYTESPATKEIDSDSKETPIHQDYLLATPVSAQVTAREKLEKARLRPRIKPELIALLRRFPADPVVPGDVVEFKADTWSKAGKTLPKPVAGKKMRVREVRFTATASDQGPDADHGLAHTMYKVEGALHFASKDDKHIALPPYIQPTYPRYIEGKIVSETGAEDELTYQIYTDKDTSVEQYKIKVPLWENQEIFVPFNPNLFPGHYFYPAYKNQRVLVAVDFDRAWLKRYLDWRPEGRLATDTQGDHILVGKKPSSSTSVKHVYGEDKPEFQILRTHEKDVQTIHIKEGYMLIEVKEKK